MEYSIIQIANGGDIVPLAVALVNGWKITQTDSTDGMIIYILSRSIKEKKIENPIERGVSSETKKDAENKIV